MRTCVQWILASTPLTTWVKLKQDMDAQWQLLPALCLQPVPSPASGGPALLGLLEVATGSKRVAQPGSPSL